MSMHIVEKATGLLPEALRRSISTALEAEDMVREGQAALARTEGENSPYERVLRQAIDNVVTARLEALRAVEAFRKGDIGLKQAVSQVETWSEASARVLWQRLEDIDGSVQE